MFSLGSSHRYFLYGESVDMRKGFDGLSGLIRNHLDRDPLSGEVYLFLNRSRSLINLLEIGVGGYDDPQLGGNSLRMWKNYQILQTSCPRLRRAGRRDKSLKNIKSGIWIPTFMPE